jgi:hypothetical protein
MPSDNWIEDERDKRHNIVYSKSSEVREEKSLCDILKEYYKEEQESRYTWSHNDHKKEIEKRKMPTVPKPPRIVQEVKVNQKEDVAYQDEEFNDDLMEKTIYRKCWYS